MCKKYSQNTTAEKKLLGNTPIFLGLLGIFLKIFGEISGIFRNFRL